MVSITQIKSQSDYQGKKLIVDSFYREKTFERLQLYSERFEVAHRAKIINGEQCDSLLDLVKCIPWKKFEEEIILGEYHGLS